MKREAIPVLYGSDTSKPKEILTHQLSIIYGMIYHEGRSHKEYYISYISKFYQRFFFSAAIYITTSYVT